MLIAQYNLDTFLQPKPYALEIIDVNDEVRHRFSAANVMATRVQTLPDTDVAYLNVTTISSNHLIKLSFENEFAAIQAKVELDQAIVEILAIGAISQVTQWNTRPTDKRLAGQLGFNTVSRKMEYWDGSNWQVLATETILPD